MIQVEYKLLLIELQIMKSLQVDNAVSLYHFVLFGLLLYSEMYQKLTVLMMMTIHGRS